MAAVVDNTATLTSLVSVANSKTEPKILKDGNYTVLSVKPLHSTTSPHNTVATVEIDLAANSPIAIVSTDRYARRQVEFTRIDLRDIAEFRGIQKNEKRQYIGTITDIASAITLLNAAIAEDEITLIKTADATVVKATETSLGYIGAITFAGVNAVPPALTGLVINGLTALTVGGETTYSVTAVPTGADASPVVWSAVSGIIDETGTYLAPGAETTDTITASVTTVDGTITATLDVTITAA